MAIRKQMPHRTWSVAEAKARLDDVIEEAEEVGPQEIVRNSDELAVIAPVDEWEHVPWHEGTIADFFHNSPLRGLDIDFERHPDTVADLRDVDLPDLDN